MVKIIFEKSETAEIIHEGMGLQVNPNGDLMILSNQPGAAPGTFVVTQIIGSGNFYESDIKIGRQKSELIDYIKNVRHDSEDKEYVPI